MLLVIVKAALVAFLVIGVATIIVAYVRGLRRVKSQRQQPDPDLGPSSMRGIVPPTPLPDWAYWDDDDQDGTGTNRLR